MNSKRHSWPHGPSTLIVERSAQGLVLAAAVLLLSAACGRSPAPSGPTSTGDPLAAYMISGTISEMTPSGPTPVEGVYVAEERSRLAMTTNASGAYTLAGLNGPIQVVTAEKLGYAPVRRSVSLSGDARLDLQLSRLPVYTLSGVVYEMDGGRRPVQGVSIFCHSCGGPEGHASSFTDKNGFYSFEANNGPAALIVEMEGYRLAEGQTGSDGALTPIVNGDTRFDIEVLRH